MTYGDHLKMLREGLGLTQRQVGEACGYEGESAETTVRHWEKGRSYPPADKLRALAKVLQTNLNVLVP